MEGKRPLEIPSRRFCPLEERRGSYVSGVTPELGDVFRRSRGDGERESMKDLTFPETSVNI